MVDRCANKVCEWVSRSTNQRNELEWLLNDVFEEDDLVVLQIHKDGGFLEVKSCCHVVVREILTLSKKHMV